MKTTSFRISGDVKDEVDREISDLKNSGVKKTIRQWVEDSIAEKFKKMAPYAEILKIAEENATLIDHNNYLKTVTYQFPHGEKIVINHKLRKVIFMDRNE